MDKIIIEGGASLCGTVHVSGAKNAALPVVAAALLAEGDHLVRNVPDLADVRTMGRLLGHAGCTFERVPGSPSAVTIRARASWSSGHCSPAGARPASPCRAAAPSVRAPSTST
jgi:UDP-N-acetylglucosamine 1-carboxyvinyltransferase